MGYEKNVLAFDIGASSGRAMLCSFDGKRIALKEIHRFPNDPVPVNGTVYWDILRLFHEVKAAINIASAEYRIDSIGIDTWGLDFGLIGKDGSLLENPVHYRDARCEGMIEEACKLMPKEEIYRRTGIQFMRINSLYQLLSLAKGRPELLDRTESLLFIPDLLAYFLTGEKNCEYTDATTSQIINAKTRQWDDEIIAAMGINKDIFLPVSLPGKIIGRLSRGVRSETAAGEIPVIAVAGHDTGSAVAAVPAQGKDFVYISSGTWSLMGTETDAPVITDKSFASNLTNEGGVGGTIRLLKNIMGMWLIQECRRRWQVEGRGKSYAELDKEVYSCKAFKSMFDPDLDELMSPEDMPRAISALCLKTGQTPPETSGEMSRSIYESLAMRYRQVFSMLKEATGKNYDAIHIVGGGMKNLMLNQMTADATGAEVYAGPAEATVLGNALLQLMTLGEIGTLAEGRKIMADSFPCEIYTPKGKDEWDEAYERFCNLTGTE